MRLLATSLFVLSLLPAAPARAAQSYDNCTGFIDALPAVVSTPGTWCLRSDLTTAITSGAAITLAANNVTLECNNFRIGGLAAGSGTTAIGIRGENRMNATVRGCTVRGFLMGLNFNGVGAGNLVEDNRFDGNTWYGIYTTTSGTIIRDNQVVDTGGSTVSPTQAFGIFVYGDGYDVSGNVVAGVMPLQATGSATGIRVTTGDGGNIHRNRVSLQAPGLTGDAIGIHATSGHPMIFENSLHGVSGNASAIGILCSAATITIRDNLIARFATGTQDCFSGGGNDINPN